MEETQMNQFNSDGPIESVPVNLNKTFSKKWLVAVAVIFIVLLGGGAGAYFYFFQEPKPEEVLKKMAISLSQVKAGEFSAELNGKMIEPVQMSMFGGSNSLGLLPDVEASSSLDINSGNPKFLNLTINISGGQDYYDVQNAKAYVAADFKADALGKVFSLGLEERQIGKVKYLSITNMSFPESGMLDLFIGAIKNKWIRIDLEELKKSLPPAISDKFSLLEEKTTVDAKKQQDLVEKIMQMFWQADLIKVVAILPSEILDGQNVFHYQWIINTANVKEFTQNFAKEIGQGNLSESDLVKLDEVIKKINEAQNNSETKAEIWISKKDFLPRQLKLSNLIFDSQNVGISNPTKANLSFSDIKVSFKNYDKPLVVNSPEQSVSFTEFIGGIFGNAAMLGGLGEKKQATTTLDDSTLFGGIDSVKISEDLNSDADHDGLTLAEEKTYGTDPNKTDTDNDGLDDYQEVKIWHTNPLVADTDGDGYLDGAEVKGGYNPNGPGKIIKK